MQPGFDNQQVETELSEQPTGEKKIKKKVQVINILKKITGKPKIETLTLENISDNQSVYNNMDRPGSFHEGFSTVSHKKYVQKNPLYLQNIMTPTHLNQGISPIMNK